MNKIRTRMHKILKDTVEHFNQNNRSTTTGGLSCVYVPQDEMIGKTEGCAIGRLLPQWAKDEIMEKNMNGGYGATRMFNHLSRTPRAFKGMRVRDDSNYEFFLDKVQQLHDSAKSWDEKGITETGHKIANEICKQFSLDNLEFPE